MDLDGQVVIPAKYAAGGRFHEGLAPEGLRTECERDVIGALSRMCEEEPVWPSDQGDPMPQPRKTLLAWSSGKDSAYALWTLRQDPTVEVTGLLTALSEGRQHEVPEAYYRAVPHSDTQISRSEGRRAGKEYFAVH